ncbi:probable UDP-sugar transporter protein SLC35A4 [Biomphalaria glabrata]|nr:probable UDP-sugar transporter protein SLC35A4 [Biomphalaria glabrata]XP_055895943.1 probable UDP-sugar transporter protein SLC35A4 [Biomphalaria glabrata]XP_055895948.1 probable UDP-sugar transporter protein SLC35A4 [Biomphalaria glabrata]XP_055895957.1 probable UDP-sugar transporter protein SLC35A4 [Biomphalaria glabrata]
MSVNCRQLLWGFVLFLVVLMYGCYGVLIDLCKVDGEIPFLTASSVLLTEILKLFICLLVLLAQYKVHLLPLLTWKVVLPFSLPALCYAVNNNLAVFMQTQMDPATYMILGNLKIVTTAILYKIIINKKFSDIQWLAICLLTIGGIINSIAALKGKTLALSEIHTTFLGLAILLCYCFISGFAGVYTEYILKKNLELSVFYQNVLLYTFGVMFNLICWLVQAYQKYVSTNQNYFDIFHGYSLYTWTVIITQAMTGILFSLIMKYNSNIVRLFIIAAAPFVTTALSYYLFDLHIHSEFVISAFFILIAALIYNYNPT